jgi:metal transporter CNNM
MNFSLLSGYSRIPVHEPGRPLSFIGLLLIKKVRKPSPIISTLSYIVVMMSLKLLKYDPSQALPVSSFPLYILPEALPSINCFQALDYLYVSYP